MAKKKSSYLISMATAAKMEKEYASRQCTALSRTGHYEETEHVYIPIDVLEDYLATAKQYATSKRTKVSGIRICISSYDWKKGSVKNPGKRLGLYLVPTKSNGKTKGTPAQRNSPLYSNTKKKSASRSRKKSTLAAGAGSNMALLGFPFPPPPPAP